MTARLVNDLSGTREQNTGLGGLQLAANPKPL